MVEVFHKELEIHVTPLEKIKMNPTDISIELDDSDEKRWRIKISPYQAFKVTTIDCVDIKPFLIDGKRPLHILEIFQSNWLDDLKEALKKKDVTADFLDKAHHYVLPFQDIIVEVVAWKLELEKL
ncbi:MAG: hypothetical protein WDZ91_15560 [Paenibacillaceae bacterium]